MRTAFLGLLPWIIAAAAQQTPSQPVEKCSIEGMVVKIATGDPLRKARLTLHRLEGREPPAGATSDSGGHFVFNDVAPGRYRLSVERSGYVRQEFGQRGSNRPGTTLSLEAGQKLNDIVFKLTPASVITGRVVDEDSEPIPNIRISSFRYAYVDGKRQMRPSAQAVTNDLGEYRLHGLPPGRYYVNATYQGNGFFSIAIGSSLPEDSYAPTFYPNTNDASRASPVEVIAGSEIRGIDISLIPIRTVRVRGKVVNGMTGQPANATVFLRPRESETWMFYAAPFRPASNGPEGQFEIRGAAPGSYVLGADHSEGRKMLTGRVPLEVGDTNIEGIQVILRPGLALTGQLRVEDNASVKISELRIVLRSRGMTPRGGGGGEGRVKEDGSFTIANVSNDAYTIALAGPLDEAYLKSARVGGQDVLENGIDLTSAEAGPAPLELIVSPGGGRIDGTVLDEKQPVAGAIVALVPESPRRAQTIHFKSATTDQNGRYMIRGIVPGNYKLFAWADVEPGAYMDPDFLKPYEEYGAACEIKPGEKKSVELKTLAPPQN